jgi:hypothetical protein
VVSWCKDGWGGRWVGCLSLTAHPSATPPIRNVFLTSVILSVMYIKPELHCHSANNVITHYNWSQSLSPWHLRAKYLLYAFRIDYIQVEMKKEFVWNLMGQSWKGVINMVTTSLYNSKEFSPCRTKSLPFLHASQEQYCFSTKEVPWSVYILTMNRWLITTILPSYTDTAKYYFCSLPMEGL